MTTTYTATIDGVGPLSFGRYHNMTKKPRESADAFEERTWWRRLHFDTILTDADNPPEDIELLIPPMAIKNMLSGAASRLSMPVPGSSRKRFTKIFQSGILVTDPGRLGVTFDAVTKETLFVSASSSGNTRVMRSFPTIQPPWSSVLVIQVLDPAITADVLEEHLQFAGSLVGLGRFRPENGGFYGRFTVRDIQEHRAAA